MMEAMKTAFRQGVTAFLEVLRRFLRPVALGAMAAILCSCSDGDLVHERAQKATDPSREIVLAAVGAWSGNTLFGGLLNGIRLAVDEVNGSGGVLSRRLKLVVKDDEGVLAKGLLIAEEIGLDTDIAGVIGHTYSFITRPCSLSYERAGVLLVSPVSYVMNVPGQKNRFVVQTHWKVEAISKTIGALARKRGYKRLAASYVFDDVGLYAMNHFEKVAGEDGLTVVDVIPFTLNEAFFDFAFTKWKKMDIDALVFIGHRNALEPYFTAADRLGINQPLLTFNDEEALKQFSRHREGTVAISYQDKQAKTPQMQSFVKAYMEKHGTMPDEYAGEGFEAVMLICEAMRQAGTAAPADVAAAIRSMKDWQSLDGSQGFGEDGMPINDRVELMEMRGGVFEKVGGQ